MDEKVENLIRKIGCSPGPVTAELLDCLEPILRNRHDWRRQTALQVIKVLQAPDHLAFRLSVMRSEAGGEASSSGIDDNYHHLTSPEDEEWPVALREIATTGSGDRTAAVAFSNAVVNTFGNKLRNDRPEARKDFLSRHRGFFEQVLARVEGLMTPQDAVTLRKWIAESAMLGLQDLLHRAEAERDRGRWVEVEQSALKLREILQSQEQVDEVDAALARVRAYNRWRKRFDALLELIQGFRFCAQPMFPWAAPETASKMPVTTVAQVDDVRTGLDTWGAPHDLDAWQGALRELSRGALHDLCSAHNKSPIESLKCMADLRGQWLESLGQLPESETWDQAAQRLREELEARVSIFLAELRSQFLDCRSLHTSHRTHPELPGLGSIATEAQSAFAKEVSQLESIDRDLTSWWDEGDTHALDDGRMDGLRGDLEALRTGWGQSVGYAEYWKRFDRLAAELRVLHQARQELRHGDPSAALSTLERGESPSAERLKTDAKQLGLDQVIRLVAKAGHLDQITETDLAGASQDAQAFFRSHLLGRDFVATLAKRDEDGSHALGFTAFCQEKMDLLAQQPPNDAQLSDPDMSKLTNIRQRLRDRIARRADQEIDELKNRALFYPLLDNTLLVRLEDQVKDLSGGLELPGLHQTDTNRLTQAIQPIKTGLQVHRACIDNDWKTADAVLSAPDLDAYLTLTQRRELKATLETSRLTASKAPDSAWLAFFRDLSDILMSRSELKALYLRLLRVGSSTDYGEDIPILERWFPAEEYLKLLLESFSDPASVEDIDASPSKTDEAVYVRLLKHLMESPHHYYQVQRLWELLPSETQLRLWGTEPSPVEHVSELLRRAHEKIEVALASPDTEVSRLRHEVDDLIKTGMISARTIKMLDVADSIERRIRRFDQLDPWDSALGTEYEDVKRDLGYLTPEIRNARSWSRVVGQRIEGLRAWEDLDAAWKHFSQRFSQRFTGFHTDSRPWVGFQELLRRWIESIDLAVPRLHWGLPRAHESRRWTNLVKAWAQSQEGRIYLACTPAPPQDLSALRDFYDRIARQIDDFARLHARLLEGVTPESLTQLHEVQPMSRPVEQIKAQLTNPEAAVVIGTAYQRFFAERAPS